MIKLPYFNEFKVVVVGAGGTGGVLIQNLAHFALGQHKKIYIVIIDGDAVEPRNVGRQKFAPEDVGKNKAECLAVRYSDVFGLDIGYIPEYIRDTEMLASLLTEEKGVLPVLVMAVDNNFSRKIAHRVFYDDRMRTLAYIDTGNEDGRGQTVLGLKWNGNVFQDPAGKVFPDILESDDQIQEGGSCGREIVRDTQTLLENVWSATIAFTYLVNLIKDGEIPSHYTFFDVKGAWSRSVENERIKNLSLSHY